MKAHVIPSRYCKKRTCNLQEIITHHGVRQKCYLLLAAGPPSSKSAGNAEDVLPKSLTSWNSIATQSGRSPPFFAVWGKSVGFEGCFEVELPFFRRGAYCLFNGIAEKRKLNVQL